MTKIEPGYLKSSLTGRRFPYRVVLPDAGADREKSRPVLYLLHGLFGSCDNFLELTRLTEYVAGKRLAVVLPEGGDGWYTDSASATEEKFESYLLDELMPAVENRYRFGGKREARAVAGLSMGGYGALKFACKRPDLFIFAGSMSGAFDAPSRTARRPGRDWETLGPSIEKAFGAEDGRTRRENDLFRLVADFPPDGAAELPFIYFDCGLGDAFLETNRKLRELLRKKGIPHLYRELPGGHDWDYWNRRTEFIIGLATERLNGKTTQGHDNTTR